MRRVRDLAVLVGATAVSVLGLCDVAAAETYEVTRTDDPGIGPCLPGDCSLREAARAADFSVGVPDVIVIPPSAGHYAIEQGAVEIGDTTEVRGAGADKVVLDSNGKSFAVETEGLSVVLSGLTITGGHGGIQDNSVELTLRGVSIEHNDRIDGGGGGIQANGKLKVYSSFIGFNSTNGTAGGAIQSNEPLTIVNSTLASNKSLGPAIQANSETTISSSALLFNQRQEPGVAGIHGTGAVTLADDIIAGNHSSDGTVSCDGPMAPITSSGGTVEDDDTCRLGPRDRVDTAPGLGALELHGGTTPVFSLLPGSAAVDFGLNCPPTDQRGAPRPQGAACDSGPFELEQAPAPAPLRSVSILIGGGKVHINRKGFGRIRLTCPASEPSPPCSGVLTLQRQLPVGGAKEGPVAKAKFTIGGDRTKAVRFHLSRSSVDELRKNPASRKVIALARVSDATGNSGQGRQIIHLVPPKKKR
jgi:hypothetical protein